MTDRWITYTEARAKVLLTVGTLVAGNGYADAASVRRALVHTGQVAGLDVVAVGDMLAELMSAGLIAREPGYGGERVVLTTLGYLTLADAGGVLA